MGFFSTIRDLFRNCYLICVLCLASPSYANEDNQDIMPNDPLLKKTLTIVRGVGNFPPLEMIENGHLTGLHIEMIRDVASQLGIELEFTSLPWARAIKTFSSGKADAISYFGYTKEREKFAFYYDDNILSNTRWVFLALEERQHEFILDSSFSGLEKLIVGVQHGYSYGEFFDGVKHFKRDIVLSEFDLELMLKKRRHDLSLISYQEFLGFKERGDFKGVVPLSPKIEMDPQYLAFSRVNRENVRLKYTAELFAKEFKRFKASDSYTELLEKYHFSRYK